MRLVWQKHFEWVTKTECRPFVKLLSCFGIITELVKMFFVMTERKEKKKLSPGVVDLGRVLNRYNSLCTFFEVDILSQVLLSLLMLQMTMQV